jgi:hypothetical protein
MGAGRRDETDARLALWGIHPVSALDGTRKRAVGREYGTPSGTAWCRYPASSGAALSREVLRSPPRSVLYRRSEVGA